jgi:hypothetical protein
VTVSLASTITYHLTCTGPGGSVSATPVTVTVTAPLPVCTGSTPNGSQICPGDEANLPKTLVGSCTVATKCEYTCIPPSTYSAALGACIPPPPVCTCDPAQKANYCSTARWNDSCGNAVCSGGTKTAGCNLRWQEVAP